MKLERISPEQQKQVRIEVTDPYVNNRPRTYNEFQEELVAVGLGIQTKSIDAQLAACQKQVDEAGLTEEGLRQRVADAVAQIFYRSSMDKLEQDENLSAIHNCWEAQEAVIPIIKEEGIKEGLDAALTAYESTCQALIEEAVQKERDSIRQAVEGIENPYPDKARGFFGSAWRSASDYYGNKHGFNKAIQAVLKVIGGKG